MPPVVSFETTDMFKSFKEVLRSAICAVSHLIHFRGKRFRYICNVRFRYLQVCYACVFTTHIYDKSTGAKILYLKVKTM